MTFTEVAQLIWLLLTTAAVVIFAIYLQLNYQLEKKDKEKKDKKDNENK